MFCCSSFLIQPKYFCNKYLLLYWMIFIFCRFFSVRFSPIPCQISTNINAQTHLHTTLHFPFSSILAVCFCTTFEWLFLFYPMMYEYKCFFDLMFIWIWIPWLRLASAMDAFKQKLAEHDAGFAAEWGRRKSTWCVHIYCVLKETSLTFNLFFKPLIILSSQRIAVAFSAIWLSFVT